MFQREILIFLLCAWAAIARAENLLLITLDTTRADHLSCYGARASTPNLDALASRGTRFLEAYTPVPSTLPAHTVLLSGLEPDKTGVRGNVYFRLPADVPWLPSAFRDRGFTTAAFVSSRILDRRFGLDRGFDLWDQPEGKERRAEETVEALRRALGGLREPFFLWVHFFDPHDPYTPPEPFRSRAATPYAGEVEYMDAQVGILLDLLKGALGRTWVVAAADHGEMLFEHGEPTHGYSLYQPAMHIPLLVVPPGGRPSPAVVAERATLADLSPTLRRLFGLPAVPSDGRDLLSELPPGRAVYMETYLPFYTFRWAPLKGFLMGSLKFLHGSRDQTFRVKGDAETEVTQEEPALHARLGARFAARLRDPGRGATPAAVPVGLKEQLMSLGYLSSPSRGSPAESAALPHPLDMLDLLPVLVSGVQRLMDEKRYDDVRTEMRGVLKRSPENLVAYYALARSYFMQDRYKEAAQAWEHTLQFQEGDPWVLSNIALCHARLGDPARAEALFRSALSLVPDDPDVLSSYSGFLADAGKPEAALALFPPAMGRPLRKIKAALLDRVAPTNAALAAGRLWEAVRLDPDTVDHAKRLVSLYLDEGKPREALKVLDFSRRNCGDPTGRAEAEKAWKQLKEML